MLKERWPVILIFLLLIARVFFYNSLLPVAQTPDYDYHNAVAKIYKNNPSIIFFWDKKDVKIACNDPVIYRPPVSTSPFLYHSLVGKVWYIFEALGFKNAFALTSLVQSVLGLLTVWYIYKLATLITRDKWVHYLVLFIAAMLPMFGFIINYISYDNLVNLAGAASIFYLFAYLKNNKIKDGLFFAIFTLVGMLTKLAFGPLFVVLWIIMMLHSSKRLKQIIGEVKRYAGKRVNLIPITVFLILAALFVVFYGRNVVKYGSYSPRVGRNEERTCPPPKTINKNVPKNEDEAEKPINELPLTGWSGNKIIYAIEYLPVWSVKMTEGVFNIVSHRSLAKTSLYHKVLFVFLVTSSAGLLWALFRRKQKELWLLLLIAFSYGFYLFYFVNLRTFINGYADPAARMLSIQGRYIFPVLSPLVFLFAYGLMGNIKNKKLRILIFALLLLFLFYGDMFYFLRHYKVWYLQLP